MSAFWLSIKQISHRLYRNFTEGILCIITNSNQWLYSWCLDRSPVSNAISKRRAIASVNVTVIFWSHWSWWCLIMGTVLCSSSCISSTSAWSAEIFLLTSDSHDFMSHNFFRTKRSRSLNGTYCFTDSIHFCNRKCKIWVASWTKIIEKKEKEDENDYS